MLRRESDLRPATRRAGSDLKYSYDFLNRLVRVRRAADDSLLAQYAYDALGRRVLKVDYSHTPTPPDSDVTRYIYDTYDAIAEYDGSDALEGRYILSRRIDEPLVMDRRDVADVDQDSQRPGRDPAEDAAQATRPNSGDFAAAQTTLAR